VFFPLSYTGERFIFCRVAVVSDDIAAKKLRERAKALSRRVLQQQGEVAYPRIALRSCCGDSAIGLMAKFSTSTPSTLGVMNAGREGPRRMSFIPR